MELYDWVTIRAEYIAGGVTYMDLARKYGVSYRQQSQRGHDEGWRAERAKHRDQIAQKAVDMASEMRARSIANVMTAADKLSTRLISDMDAIDGARDVADVAKALKYAIDTLTAVYGIQTPAQKHRQRMDEERLKLDKRRLELEISKQERDSNPPPVRIVIEQPEGDDLDG